MLLLAGLPGADPARSFTVAQKRPISTLLFNGGVVASTRCRHKREAFCAHSAMCGRIPVLCQLHGLAHLVVSQQVTDDPKIGEGFGRAASG